MKVFIGLLLGITSFSSYAIDLTKSLSPASYTHKDDLPESTTSVADILKQKVHAPTQVKESNIDELCLFGCNLNRNLSTFDAGQALVDLNTILRKNYGLQKDASCKLYRKVNGTSPMALRMTVPNVYGNDADGIDFYSDKILNDSNTWRVDSRRISINLSNPNDPNLITTSDLGDDIKADLATMMALKTNLDPDFRNQYISTFQKRHKFLEKSCGTDFMTAYDQFLDHYAKNKQIPKSSAEILAENKKRREDQRALDEAKSKNQEILMQQKFEDKQKEEQALRDRQTQCEASHPYRLYRASDNIYQSLIVIKEKEASMQKLQRIEKTGGVINPNLRYSLATIIENSKDQITYNFQIYKSLGGTASTPSGVKRITNPCPK